MVLIESGIGDRLLLPGDPDAVVKVGRNGPERRSGKKYRPGSHRNGAEQSGRREKSGEDR